MLTDICARHVEKEELQKTVYERQHEIPSLQAALNAKKSEITQLQRSLELTQRSNVTSQTDGQRHLILSAIEAKEREGVWQIRWQEMEKKREKYRMALGLNFERQGSLIRFEFDRISERHPQQTFTLFMTLGEDQQTYQSRNV